MKLERVIFAGGGTGGHVYMAVALANELRRQAPDTRILFVGTRRGLESRIVPSLGFELRTIEVGGLKNVGIVKVLRTAAQIPSSLLASWRMVRGFRPCVIAGVGGYASGPVVLAGRLSGYPCLLIEPNAYPGFTNRLLSRVVDQAAVAFQEAADWFGKKARLTGIPIRADFLNLQSAPSPDGRLRVLIIGGSQGSRAINSLVCEALPSLPQRKLAIVHQTGPSDFARVKESYVGNAFHAEVTDFIDDVPGYFTRSDLVISRAGASSVAEITAAGKASVLIPFPGAADDHQRKNALALQRAGASLLLEQGAVSGKELAELIVALESDRDRLSTMANNARSLGRFDSTGNVLRLMQELAAGKGRGGR
jgi:UDP-N-acetylglucosamine--N-acetylmuramyl-(pentapeptide) pyrophosphoryl-undecaprenol N-acetylglucosamine transferase